LCRVRSNFHHCIHGICARDAIAALGEDVVCGVIGPVLAAPGTGPAARRDLGRRAAGFLC
jgi:hypothetical protein